MSRHHNFQYDGSVPEALQDVYFGQDIVRDFYANKQAAALYSLFGGVAVVSGLVVTQGAGDTLNIASGYALGLYDVTLPDSYATIPPTTRVETIPMMIELSAALTDQPITSATLDGSTVNYVKLAYTENIEAATRQKRKGSASYNYEVSDSYILTVDSTPPTSDEVQLDTFIGSAGGTFYFSGEKSGSLTVRTVSTDENVGVVTVFDQRSFNRIWERTGANAYKIKDSIVSVKMRPLSGGYKLNGATSPLSGGDSYGVFSTNNCKFYEAEPGAFMQLGDDAGYLTVDTADAIFNNLHLERVNSGSSSADQTLRTTTTGIIFNNLILKNITSSAAANTYLINPTAALVFNGIELNNCTINAGTNSIAILRAECIKNLRAISCTFNSASSGFLFQLIEKGDGFLFENCVFQEAGGVSQVFYNCSNINNVYFNSCTVINRCYLFYDVKNLSNVYIDGITYSGPDTSFIVRQSENVSNVKILNIDFMDTSICTLFETTNEISGVNIESLNINNISTHYIFNQCNNISDFKFTGYTVSQNGAISMRVFYQSQNINNVYIHDFDLAATYTGAIFSAFNGCEKINNVEVFNVNTPTSLSIDLFYDSDFISNVRINDYSVLQIMFNICNYITNVRIISSGVIHFKNCNHISNARLETNLGASPILLTCEFINNVSVTNGLSTGFDSCSYISNCEASNCAAQEFATCLYISSSTFTGSTLGCDYVDTTSASIPNKVSCPGAWA